MKRFIILLAVLLFAVPVFSQGPPVNSRTNRPPSWSHRPPSWNHRPPTWNHRPPTWNRRPPTVWHRPPGWHPRPPNWHWRSMPSWNRSHWPGGWGFGAGFGISGSSFSSSAVFVQSTTVAPIQTVFIAEPPARDQIVVVKIGDTIVSRLRPGEAVITPDGLVLENVDGQLVVHRGQ